MAKEITMKFAPGKPTEMSVKGVKGSGCHEFAKTFQKVLGGKIAAEQATAEMAEVATTSVAQVQNQGA